MLRNNANAHISSLGYLWLQKLQNRAVRVLTFSRYDADTNRLFRQLNRKDCYEHSVLNIKKP